MSITDLEAKVSYEFFAPEFLKFVEDNLPYFTQPQRLQVMAVDPAIGYKYEGDFYGLLTHLKVPHNLHYLNMRINGYEHPMQFAADRAAINVYSGDDINALAKALNTKVR